MDENEQRMFDSVQKELNAAKMDEKDMLETMCVLQAENHALWMLIEAMRKRIEGLR